MLFLTVSSAHGLAVISHHSTIRPPDLSGYSAYAYRHKKTITEGKKKVHAIVDLPDAIAPELQIFFFGLAQILWDRHAIIGTMGG